MLTTLTHSEGISKPTQLAAERRKSSFCLTCAAVPQRDPQKPEICCAAVNGGGVVLRHAAFVLSVL